MNKATVIALVGLGILGAIVPRAAADEWDQKTMVTFSGPVAIPDQVLPAGTYEFKLANSTGDRNIVQVFSQDEKHLYGTFLTIPEQRSQPAESTIITLDERPGDSPEAVKAWFYPGDETGHEFIYR
jgi:hypothetical protein